MAHSTTRFSTIARPIWSRSIFWVNGEPVDALAQLVHRDKARPRALRYCERLAESIPKQQFRIAIQGTIGGKIIARTNINAFRKDVTASATEGDITRKRKLLEKQKAGKRRMKMVATSRSRSRPSSPCSSPMASAEDARRAGVYVHLPFCSAICPYCDFAVTVGGADRRRSAGGGYRGGVGATLPSILPSGG